MNRKVASSLAELSATAFLLSISTVPFLVGVNLAWFVGSTAYSTIHRAVFVRAVLLRLRLTIRRIDSNPLLLRTSHGMSSLLRFVSVTEIERIFHPSDTLYWNIPRLGAKRFQSGSMPQNVLRKNALL